MKKNNKKGFTLAELLIVVAIIAVLTAIAIPVFTGQLEKAKEAADMANVRSFYAQEVARVLTEKDATYANAYGGATLNYPDKLEWTGGDTLTVIYTATKLDSLSLSAGNPNDSST